MGTSGTGGDGGAFLPQVMVKTTAAIVRRRNKIRVWYDPTMRIQISFYFTAEDAKTTKKKSRR
jgi:hypothetical protein